MTWGQAFNGLVGTVVVGAVVALVGGAVRRFDRSDWRAFGISLLGTTVVAWFVLLAMFWHDLHRNTLDDPSDAPLFATIVLPFVGLPCAATASFAIAHGLRVKRRRRFRSSATLLS